MKVGAGDRLVFAMGYITAKRELIDSVTQLDLSRALILSRSRLQHTLGELKDRGLVRRGKRDSIAGYILTGSGVEKYVSILNEISSRELVPELHQVSVRCKVSYLMELVKNPLDLVYIVSCYLKRTKVDIIEKLDQLKAINPGSNDSLKLKEMLQDAEEDREELEKIISDLTLLGSRSDRPEKPDEYTTNSIDQMLIIADLKRRRGEIKEARWYYSSVLEKRNVLPSSRWIICIVGLIQCTLALEGQQKALEMIQRSYESIKDPAHIAMIRKVEADIESDRNDYGAAKKLYKSCLGIFRSKKMNLMEIAILNNFGVMMFRQDNFGIAEKYWLKARNNAEEYGFIYAKALIEVNLSDPFALKGKIKRAKNMLYDSKRYMEEIGDAEGLSLVYFNQALVSIEEGIPESAITHFKKSEEFPLMYCSDREERRDVFFKRYRSKGFKLPI